MKKRELCGADLGNWSDWESGGEGSRQNGFPSPRERTQKQTVMGGWGVGVVGTLSSNSDLCSWRCLGKSVSIGTLKLGVQIREVLAGGGASWMYGLWKYFLDREAHDHSVCCLPSACYVQTHCTHHPLLPGEIFHFRFSIEETEPLHWTRLRHAGL